MKNRKIIKKKSGGKRDGAGAKQKYDESTETISFRIPKSKKEAVKKIVKEFLSEFTYP